MWLALLFDLLFLYIFAKQPSIVSLFFQGMEPPARSAIAVAALPLGAEVEIEAIAIPGSAAGKDKNEK